MTPQKEGFGKDKKKEPGHWPLVHFQNSHSTVFSHPLCAAGEALSLTPFSEGFSALHCRTWSCALVSPSLKWGYFLLFAMVVAKV